MASDGPFYIACANDRLYRRLVVDVLERPDLMTDPAFANRESAYRQQGEAARDHRPRFLHATSRENWMAKMKKANLPVGYLRTVEEGFNAPEVRGRGRAQPDPHPTGGRSPTSNRRSSSSLTPTVDPVAAPLLGQHTREVLHDTLGYDDSQIAKLKAAGVFGTSLRDT